MTLLQVKSFIISCWSHCGRNVLSLDLQESFAWQFPWESSLGIPLSSCKEMKGIIATFYLDFQGKKNSFPLTYPASTSQVARKELPRNVQRFRDLFVKKTPNRSKWDRMISSFLVHLLCSTSQRPSLRRQKRRGECVDISRRPCLLLPRENKFWAVLHLLRSFLMVKIYLIPKEMGFLS